MDWVDIAILLAAPAVCAYLIWDAWITDQRAERERLAQQWRERIQQLFD